MGIEPRRAGRHHLDQRPTTITSATWPLQDFALRGATPGGCDGSGRWDRTTDHAINNRALYQLSYPEKPQSSLSAITPLFHLYFFLHRRLCLAPAIPQEPPEACSTPNFSATSSGRREPPINSPSSTATDPLLGRPAGVEPTRSPCLMVVPYGHQSAAFSFRATDAVTFNEFPLSGDFKVLASAFHSRSLQVALPARPRPGPSHLSPLSRRGLRIEVGGQL